MLIPYELYNDLSGLIFRWNGLDGILDNVVEDPYKVVFIRKDEHVVDRYHTFDVNVFSFSKEIMDRGDHFVEPDFVI